MARISTYALDSTINDNDKLIGTDADQNNSTKNFSLSGVADYTIDRLIDPDATDFHIPVFNQGGVRITDSIISQNSSVSNGTAGTAITISGDLTVTESASINDDLTVEGVSYLQEHVYANGNVDLGNTSSDIIKQYGTLELLGPVKDSTGSFGTADQVLTTDGSATSWQDAGTVTGSGTAGKLAIWSTGTELGDSPITVTADGSSWDYEFESTNEFIINSNGINDAFLRVNETGVNALVFSYDSQVQLGSFTNWQNGGFMFTNQQKSLLSIGSYINSNAVIVHTDLEVQGPTTKINGVLNVGDETGWDPQPQGHRLRVKGDTRQQSAAPGVVVQNDQPANGSYTRGIFLAQRGIVELGSISDSDVELKVGDQPIVELKSNKVQCNKIITVQDSDSASKLTIKTTSTNSSIEVENQTSFHLITGEDRRISVAADGTTKINYTNSSPDNVPLLAVDGGIKVGNNYTNIGQHNLPATAEDAGTLRYWEGPNKVRLEIAMKVAKNPDVYQWINIKDIDVD